MGIFTGNGSGFKGRKDYISIFKLDIIITGNIKERGDDNFNNFDDDKDYKKN